MPSAHAHAPPAATADGAWLARLANSGPPAEVVHAAEKSKRYCRFWAKPLNGEAPGSNSSLAEFKGFKHGVLHAPACHRLRFSRRHRTRGAVEFGAARGERAGNCGSGNAGRPRQPPEKRLCHAVKNVQTASTYTYIYNGRGRGRGQGWGGAWQMRRGGWGPTGAPPTRGRYAGAAAASP